MDALAADGAQLRVCTGNSVWRNITLRRKLSVVASTQPRRQPPTGPEDRLQKLERQLSRYLKSRAGGAPTRSDLKRQQDILQHQFALSLQDLLTVIDAQVDEPSVRATLLKRARAALSALDSPSAAKRWLKARSGNREPPKVSYRKLKGRARIRAAMEADKQQNPSETSVRTVGGGLPGLGKRT